MEEITIHGTERAERPAAEEDFIMLPVVDFCFKELMKNDRVRRGFTASLLGRDPEELEDPEILPGELPGDYEDEKQGILDVLVSFRDGTRINLEMQVLAFGFWRERVLFYLSRIFAGQLKKGAPYKSLQKCIHVSILNFSQFPEDSRCLRAFHLRDDATGEIYSEKLEIIVMELKKLPPEDRREGGIIRWMRFFSGKRKEDFVKIAETDPYIEEAYRELERLSADENRRWEYEAREKALRDYISFREEGWDKGWNKGWGEGHEKGLAEGREKGLAEGREEGRAEGREEGRAEGHAEGLAKGREEGRTEGEERVNRLIRLLVKDRRYEDLAKAANDREYQRELFEHYQI